MSVPRILVPVLACALLAACVSAYRAPVVERNVTRPVPARPAAPEQKPETHTVKRGDTLFSIALDNGIDYRELAAWNNLSDPSVLKPGAVLRLRPPPVQQMQPEARAQAQPQPDAGVQVQPILTPGAVEVRSLGPDQRAATEPPRAAAETPRAIVEPKVPASEAAARPELLKTGPRAMKLPYSDENLALLLRQSPPETKAEAVVPLPGAAESDGVDWMWPAPGRVLAGFSKGTNKGLDILGKIGDPVVASASGRVVYSGTGLRGYGKLVIIKHNDTFVSAYAHNSKVLVKEGQSVAKGQKIAEIGNSDSPQVKLHFEIRRFSEPVDPLKFLPERRS
ncbi:MAG TPA: peptidoglycan DD-metalloendopeptidase family protein [Burkholderiales bacterium]|nr:peptidoglycan DD-metalloendopeptidase family protein [Burkholderiales bacterium]